MAVWAMSFSRLFSIMQRGSLRSLVLLGVLLASNVVLTQLIDADLLFEPCMTRDGNRGHCRPSSECHDVTQVVPLTIECSKPDHTCCPTKPKRQRRNVLVRLDALPECRSGYGYCVVQGECSVRAFRWRSDGCPSPFHVCCAKASVVVPQYSTTANPSTTTAAKVSSVAPSSTISILSDTLDSATTLKTDTITYRQPATELDETVFTTLPYDSEQLTERSVDPEEELIPSLPDAASLRDNFTFKGCGYRAKDGVVEQLVRNQLDRAEYGEVPWMVVIFRESNGSTSSSSSTFRHCCNGALISERAVLTTAHCVGRCGSQANQMWVRLGEWDLNSSIEPLQPEDFRVRKAHKHKDFNVHSLINNIAVLELIGEVQYGPTIQPVCLPEAQYTFSSSQETLLFTGWNATMGSVPRSSTGRNVLNTILLNHHDRQACEKEIRYIQQIPAFVLHQSFVCANVQHEGWPCGGEAGAPVVAEVPESENRYYVHGLVSRAYNCQQNRYPTTMLTSVSFFRSWIKRTLATIHNASGSV